MAGDAAVHGTKIVDSTGFSIAAARNTRSPAPLPPPTTFRGVVA